MSCTEPIAWSAPVTNQTFATSNQASAVALAFTQPKIRGFVYLRGKDCHEFRCNLVRQGTLYSA
jgi:hypothetical protein